MENPALRLLTDRQIGFFEENGYLVVENVLGPAAGELRSWETWREMWEAARAGLSRQPHIEIHRWRADSPLCA